MKYFQSFHPYAAVTILFWSLAYVFTKLALQCFSAFSLGFLRYFIASVALLFVAVVTKMKLPKRKDLPMMFVAGVVGFFVYMIAFNKGQVDVSAATGSVVIATVPVMTALFARVIYRERLEVYKLAAIAVEFVGVAVLTLLNGIFSVNFGVLWLLLAAVALSVYNIFQRKLTKTYSSLQVTSFCIFFGTLALSVFAPASACEICKAPPVQFLYLAVLGLLSSAVAYVSWAKAFEIAEKISEVSNYMFVTPFLTTLLGFVISGETPDRATVVGGGIILVGVMMFNFGGYVKKADKLRKI